MRNYPSKEDKKDIEELNVEPWMVELLKLNPKYPHWGPHEDYMLVKGDGWNSALLVESWSKMDLSLDELNEVVHFYFELHRDNKRCEECNRTGYHPDSLWVADSFYQHSSPFRNETISERQSKDYLASFSLTPPSADPLRTRGYPLQSTLNKYGRAFTAFCEQMRTSDGYWNDKITQDEVDFLLEKGRLQCDYKEKPTAAEVNERQRGRGMGHDAINRMCLIEQRLNRLGMPHSCPTCEGKGYIYTIPKGYPGLVLWLIHPRKGASRGVEIKRIEKSDLPAIKKFLQKAAKRNADRFKKVCNFKIKR